MPGFLDTDWLSAEAEDGAVESQRWELKTVNLDEVIRELRILNEPVPKSMRLPLEDEISLAETRLGVTQQEGAGDSLQHA